MKYVRNHLHTGNALLESMDPYLSEIEGVLESIEWAEEFVFSKDGAQSKHQKAYNKSIAHGLENHGWSMQPWVSEDPRLIGDFAKDLIFGEVQFGNSSTLYRDFYKFQYAVHNGMFSLAVLIVPNDELSFFPTRPESVRNMANMKLAMRYFTVLPISVPTVVYGLLSNNEAAT